VTGEEFAGSAGGGTKLLAVGRGRSDGDGSAGGAAVAGAALSPEHVGSTGQQHVQQRRLASNRHAEAGSTESRQTLVQASTILVIFRSRFIAKSSSEMGLAGHAKLGFLMTKETAQR
jgi:hypothetical protein